MITLEQVDQLRRRTNCSYEEAKALLEKHNGDVLEAIVDFERSRHDKGYASNNGYCGQNDWKKQGGDFWIKMRELIQKGFVNKVVIEDNHSNVLLNIPVNIMLLLIICIFWVTLPVIVLLLVLGYKISIKKTSGNEINISSMVKDAADKFTGRSQQQAPNPPLQNTNGTDTKKDDYNEMTVE